MPQITQVPYKAILALTSKCAPLLQLTTRTIANIKSQHRLTGHILSLVTDNKDDLKELHNLVNYKLE